MARLTHAVAIATFFPLLAAAASGGTGDLSERPLESASVRRRELLERCFPGP